MGVRIGGLLEPRRPTQTMRLLGTVLLCAFRRRARRKCVRRTLRVEACNTRRGEEWMGG